MSEDGGTDHEREELQNLEPSLAGWLVAGAAGVGAERSGAVEGSIAASHEGPRAFASESPDGRSYGWKFKQTD